MIVRRRACMLGKHDFHHGPCMIGLVAGAEEPDLCPEHTQGFALSLFHHNGLLAHHTLLARPALQVMSGHMRRDVNEKFDFLCCTPSGTNPQCTTAWSSRVGKRELKPQHCLALLLIL